MNEKEFADKNIDLKISTDDRNLIIYALNELHSSEKSTLKLKKATSDLINYFNYTKVISEDSQKE